MKQDSRDSLNKVGLPMIQLEIMGQLCWFIVDTGSNSNMIRSDMMAEYESDHPVVGMSSVSGIGGHSEEGNIYELPYSLDGEQFSDQFSVVTERTFEPIEEEYGVKICGLVGTSFMLFHRFIIDLSEGTIYICVSPNDVRHYLRKTA